MPSTAGHTTPHFAIATSSPPSKRQVAVKNSFYPQHSTAVRSKPRLTTIAPSGGSPRADLACGKTSGPIRCSFRSRWSSGVIVKSDASTSPRVEWQYRRDSGCSLCKQVDKLLSKSNVQVVKTVSTSEELRREAAEELVRGVDRILLSAGTNMFPKVVEVQEGEEAVGMMLTN